MSHQFTLTAVALSLFTFGCTEQNTAEGQAGADVQVTVEQDHAEEAGADATAVTLDNGQRWKANPETISGIANMVTLVDKQIATPGDAKAAKTALEDEFGLIFERCTMTGEAHNQLHNYLVPIHQRLSGFDAGDATQLAEMKSYLGTFGNYFE